MPLLASAPGGGLGQWLKVVLRHTIHRCCGQVVDGSVATVQDVNVTMVQNTLTTVFNQLYHVPGSTPKGQVQPNPRLPSHRHCTWPADELVWWWCPAQELAPAPALGTGL